MTVVVTDQQIFVHVFHLAENVCHNVHKCLVNVFEKNMCECLKHVYCTLRIVVYYRQSERVLKF